MGNLTTPFKASVAALISSKLVAALGMSDADAGYVADAAWMLLTAGLTYMVPANFGGGLSGRLLAWVLKIKG